MASGRTEEDDDLVRDVSDERQLAGEAVHGLNKCDEGCSSNCGEM